MRHRYRARRTRRVANTCGHAASSFATSPAGRPWTRSPIAIGTFVASTAAKFSDQRRHDHVRLLRSDDPGQRWPRAMRFIDLEFAGNLTAGATVVLEDRNDPAVDIVATYATDLCLVANSSAPMFPLSPHCISHRCRWNAAPRIEELSSTLLRARHGRDRPPAVAGWPEALTFVESPDLKSRAKSHTRFAAWFARAQRRPHRVATVPCPRTSRACQIFTTPSSHRRMRGSSDRVMDTPLPGHQDARPVPAHRCRGYASPLASVR